MADAQDPRLLLKRLHVSTGRTEDQIAPPPVAKRRVGRPPATPQQKAAAPKPLNIALPSEPEIDRAIRAEEPEGTRGTSSAPPPKRRRVTGKQPEPQFMYGHESKLQIFKRMREEWRQTKWREMQQIRSKFLSYHRGKLAEERSQRRNAEPISEAEVRKAARVAWHELLTAKKAARIVHWIVDGKTHAGFRVAVWCGRKRTVPDPAPGLGLDFGSDRKHDFLITVNGE